MFHSIKLCIIVLKTSLACGVISTTLITAAQAKGEDKPLAPPELVYDDIPARWDYYFVQPDIISKYTGEKTKKICFGADFSEFPDNYADQTQKVNLGSRSGIRETLRFKLLQGAVDFRVIDENRLLVSTPQTGTHVIQTRFCKSKLPRAKYLQIPVGHGRSSAKQCLRSSRGVAFMTGYKSRVAGCEIESINEWSGPIDSDALKAESDALEGAKP